MYELLLKRIFAILFGTVISALPAVAGQWTEGGLYVTAQENGSFIPLKILKVDNHGVHVRIYSNVYPILPARIDESVLYMAGLNKREDEPLGMGHLPISKESFAGWGARFVQQSSVTTEELEGYQMWLEAGGGYF
jgi:hypothetical protein